MQLSLQIAAGLRCALPGDALTILNAASAADDARAWSGTSALGPCPVSLAPVTLARVARRQRVIKEATIQLRDESCR
jgi:hypothetical protein